MDSMGTRGIPGIFKAVGIGLILFVIGVNLPVLAFPDLIDFSQVPTSSLRLAQYAIFIVATGFMLAPLKWKKLRGD